MHPEWATYLRVLLTLHISCGVVAFVCAPVALSTAKGGKVHRRFGKIYFWAMAGVAVTALILSFALPVFFLAMVAVFSFLSAEPTSSGGDDVRAWDRGGSFDSTPLGHETVAGVRESISPLQTLGGQEL